MKKRTAALALLAAAVLAGCSKGGGGELTPTQNMAFVEADGVVRWASVEEYEGGDYSEEEKIASAKERIAAYNSSQGSEGSENTDGAKRLPVAFVSGSMENGEAVLVTEYDTPERLLAFAEEIGDYNVPFTVFEVKPASELGGEAQGASLKTTGGRDVADPAKTVGESAFIVKTEGEGLVRGEGKVVAVTDGCEMRDEHTVKTAAEGVSYILLQ